MTELFLFDLGKVLIDFDFDIAIRKLEKFGPVDRKSVRSLFRNSSLAESWDKGTLSPEEFFDTVQKEAKLSVSMEQFKKIWSGIFSENREMVRLARSLVGRYKVIALSNTNPWHAEHVREHFPWLKEFDTLIASCEVHLLKPDHRIFNLALEKAKVSPSNTVYIDDLAENIDAAKQLGIHSLLFEGFAKLLNELEAKKIQYGTASVSLQGVK